MVGRGSMDGGGDTWTPCEADKRAPCVADRRWCMTRGAGAIHAAATATTTRVGWDATEPAVPSLYRKDGKKLRKKGAGLYY